MDGLAGLNALVIRQKKEWGEILTGIETRNRYHVSTPSGTDLYVAAEEAGGVLARMILTAMRPFQMTVKTSGGRLVLHLIRPFRFYFHEMTVTDAEGRQLGKVHRKFSWLRRVYMVTDGTGKQRFELFGPILHPWTFVIRCGRRAVGKITKKWSGLLTEGFTKADYFGITFEQGLPVSEKAVLLGAVFLIDFVHFERKR